MYAPGLFTTGFTEVEYQVSVCGITFYVFVVGLLDKCMSLGGVTIISLDQIYLHRQSVCIVKTSPILTNTGPDGASNI